jgi:hypothetical protein
MPGFVLVIVQLTFPVYVLSGSRNMSGHSRPLATPPHRAAPLMAEPTVSPMAPELLPAGRLAQAASDFLYAYIPLLRFRENQGTLAIFQISQISQLLDKKSMQT